MSQFLRAPSEVRINAPFFVPTKARTLLIVYCFYGFAVDAPTIARIRRVAKKFLTTDGPSAARPQPQITFVNHETHELHEKMFPFV